MADYIETDCTFRGFTSGGAIVTPDRIVAYPREHGELGDWHGRVIGTWRAVRTWRTPRSYVADTMSQIEAIVDGVTYTGRGTGAGMVFTGKRKAGK